MFFHTDFLLCQTTFKILLRQVKLLTNYFKWLEICEKYVFSSSVKWHLNYLVQKLWTILTLEKSNKRKYRITHWLSMRWQTNAERGDLGTRESPLQEIGITLVTERVQFFQIKNCKKIILHPPWTGSVPSLTVCNSSLKSRLLSNTLVVILQDNQSDYEWHIRSRRQVTGVCNLILGCCSFNT